MYFRTDLENCMSLWGGLQHKRPGGAVTRDRTADFNRLRAVGTPSAAFLVATYQSRHSCLHKCLIVIDDNSMHRCKFVAGNVYWPT